ncbi:unnamed protein product [Bursaphelenchus okinawaensis]|uniref:Tudor domain-containing protein n=1 Tax=Bursaphelenchus okinawaensis TaxID=465554 RepID=A0A811JVA8_9BILA|nr:unnamed protein product [Bursaphelenchus okinawaensis]CAG9084723.1 unnamed protein product [Bursaphelenchus okinawaensis]
MSQEIFNKDNGDANEDVWDDTAMIEMYDKCKAEAMEKIRISTSQENLSNKAWKVEDLCMAPYEDGKWYPAKVLSIDGDRCKVCYTEYNEEAEVDVKDLLRKDTVLYGESGEVQRANGVYVQKNVSASEEGLYQVKETLYSIYDSQYEDFNQPEMKPHKKRDINNKPEWLGNFYNTPGYEQSTEHSYGVNTPTTSIEASERPRFFTTTSNMVHPITLTEKTQKFLKRKTLNPNDVIVKKGKTEQIEELLQTTKKGASNDGKITLTRSKTEEIQEMLKKAKRKNSDEVLLEGKFKKLGDKDAQLFRKPKLKIFQDLSTSSSWKKLNSESEDKNEISVFKIPTGFKTQYQLLNDKKKGLELPPCTATDFNWAPKFGNTEAPEQLLPDFVFDRRFCEQDQIFSIGTSKVKFACAKARLFSYNIDRLKGVRTDLVFVKNKVMVKAEHTFLAKASLNSANKRLIANRVAATNVFLNHLTQGIISDICSEDGVEKDSQDKMEVTEEAAASQEYKPVSSKLFPIPSICPPPPALFAKIAKSGNEKEALTNMLMSWYMSGYHTGFYEGFKEAQKSIQLGKRK